MAHDWRYVCGTTQACEVAGCQSDMKGALRRTDQVRRVRHVLQLKLLRQREGLLIRGQIFARRSSGAHVSAVRALVTRLAWIRPSSFLSMDAKASFTVDSPAG